MISGLIVEYDLMPIFSNKIFNNSKKNSDSMNQNLFRISKVIFMFLSKKILVFIKEF